MAGKVLAITLEEIRAALQDAPPRTDDDVSITLDGWRLDSKEAVLAWIAEVEADIEAGRLVTLDDGGRVRASPNLTSSGWSRHSTATMSSTCWWAVSQLSFCVRCAAVTQA